MNKTRKNKTKILVALSLATTMIPALSVPINAQDATPLQNVPVAQSATVGTTFQSDGFTFTVISDGKVRIKSLNGKQVSQSADADTLQLDTVEHDGETYAITEIEYLDLTGYKKFVMNNLEVFNGQRSTSWADVKEVSMPSVTSLGGGAFANSKVEKVTCDSLITVGEDGFNGAKYLKEGNFPKVTTIGDKGFLGAGSEVDELKLNLPNLTTLTGGAQFQNSSIVNGSFPKLTVIPDWAFSYTSKLKSIDLPNVTLIKGSAFGKSAVETVNIPKVEEVPDNAFRECSQLKKISCPNLKKVGSAAFFKDFNLTTIDTESIEEVGRAGFSQCLSLGPVLNLPNLKSADYQAFCTLKSLKEFHAPNLTNAGEMMLYFSENVAGQPSQLEVVDLPNLEMIPTSMCLANSNLKTINIPAAKEIGYRAFERCFSIETLKLGQVTKIGNRAFASTDAVKGQFKTLYIDSENPPVVSDENDGQVLAFNNQAEPRYIYVKNPDAYRAVDDGNTQDNLWYGWTIVQRMDIEGKIKWNDNDDAHHVRPSEVEISIYKNGNKYLSQTVQTNQDNQEFVFNDLEKYDENGKLIEWTIVQSSVDHYKTEVKGDADNGFVVLNTYIDTKSPTMTNNNQKGTQSSTNSNTQSKPKTGDAASIKAVELLSLMTLSGFSLLRLKSKSRIEEE